MIAYPDQYRHVFERLHGLEGGRQTSRGRQWAAKCPAHEDERPSLSISMFESGKLGIRCHGGAGCKPADILRAIGLKFTDLFPDKGTQPRERKMAMGPQECVYQYRDEKGEILFEVVRYKEPKDFRQRRLNPAFDKSKPRDNETNRQFIWSLDGVRIVPYRLPELIEASGKAQDAPIWVLEGEKDVDNARALGLIATCGPMGAGKWSLVENEMKRVLAGKNVCVVAHDDPPGEKTRVCPGAAHAHDVLKSLQGVAKTLRYWKPYNDQTKKDLTDFINEDVATAKDRIKAYYKGASCWAGQPPQGSEPIPGSPPAETPPSGEANPPSTPPANPPTEPAPSESKPSAELLQFPRDGGAKANAFLMRVIRGYEYINGNRAVAQITGPMTAFEAEGSLEFNMRRLRRAIDDDDQVSIETALAAIAACAIVAGCRIWTPK